MINPINDSIDTLIEVQQCQTPSVLSVTNCTAVEFFYMFHKNTTHEECYVGIQSIYDAKSLKTNGGKSTSNTKI